MKALWMGLALLWLSSACVSRQPEQIGELGGGDVPLHIVVSNQSFATSPVDIDVYVDDVHVITGDFPVGSQHSFIHYDFTTGAGEHTVRAESSRGEATLEETFELPAERWGTIFYWYYPTESGDAGPTPRKLEWALHETAPMFD